MDFLYVYSALVILALYLLSQRLLHKLQNLPPCPFPALPFIGHLYLLKKPFHRALSEVSSRYGPVLLLKFGSRPVLLVASPSAAEECFTKNDVIFANRPHLISGKYFGYNYKSIAWSSYGAHWRNLRRISSIELLSSHRLQLLSHVRADEIHALLRRLFRKSMHVHDHGSGNNLVEVKTALYEFTFNVMTRMIAGKRYYGGDEVAVSEEAKMMEEITRETSWAVPQSQVLDFLPFMRWFGFARAEKKLMAIQEKRDKLMLNMIEEHRESVIGCSAPMTCRTIIEILLSLHETEPEYYTDETIRNLMLTLLQAGTDTSASTMEWAISLLLDNPHVLKKAQAEIDDHLGHGRLMNESDVAELPYLGHIIYETLRMHPAAPLLMPHESSKGCTIGGYQIPRGTMLLVNVWSMQNDPTIWLDPENFRPERFEGVDESKLGFKIMPFGAGRRGCPGENLALRMIGLALGSLIQCFDWEKPNQDMMIDMAEISGITAPKAQPLMAVCRPRPNCLKYLSQI